MKQNPERFFSTSGSFFVGCNYWASHAGTQMWSDWQPAVVEQDLTRLAQGGIQVLRVFPLWPDFQPLTLLRQYGGKAKEFGFGEKPLPDDQAGKSGISQEMMQRFEAFSRLTEQSGLKLIVGLLTGWMSGRLFVPPALEGRPILTDPVALMWQVRFVQYFVEYFKNNPAILAWDLGNECNCMQEIPDREAAWHWTACIVNAIRAVDKTRPVISGMHSLSPEGNWTMQDQGELTDVLTTHPYPVFTPYCAQEAVNTIRPLLHATAESRLYADIGKKPCLVEELGTLGPMIASDQIAADFVRVNLFSNWANDNRGVMWWCANDQTNLSQTPYEWNAVERELGLLRNDGTPKPVLQEMGDFTKFLTAWPYDNLPSNIKEGVCILSQGQDQWGVGYASFILAKQAGFDFEFQFADQPLKAAPLYLLPCIKGHQVLGRRRWLELLERVKEGATLYISYDGGFLSSFEEVTGLTVQTRAIRSGDSRLNLYLEKEDAFELDFNKGSLKLGLEPGRADVIGAENEGEAGFTLAQYGKGQVYFLNFPLEMELTLRPGAFEETEKPYWKLYRQIVRSIPNIRILTKDAVNLGVTEHALDENCRAAVLINYSAHSLTSNLTIQSGWRLKEVYYGKQPLTVSEQALSLEIAKNSALVLSFERS